MGLTREEKKDIKRLKRDPYYGSIFMSTYYTGRMLGLTKEEIYRKWKAADLDEEDEMAAADEKEEKREEENMSPSFRTEVDRVFESPDMTEYEKLKELFRIRYGSVGDGEYGYVTSKMDLLDLDSYYEEYIRDRERIAFYRSHGMGIPHSYDRDFFYDMEYIFDDELKAMDRAYEDLSGYIEEMAGEIYIACRRRYAGIFDDDEIPGELEEDFRNLITVYTIFHGFDRDHITMGGIADRMDMDVEYSTFDDAAEPYLDEVREMEGGDLYEIIVECSAMMYESVIDDHHISSESEDLIDRLDYSDEITDLEMDALYGYCRKVMGSSIICDAVERNSDGHLLDMMRTFTKTYDSTRDPG